MMKRAGNLFDKVADIDNLRLAFYKAQRGKGASAEVLAYRADLEANLLGLQAQIRLGNVEVGNYYFFKIFDPKERQICAAVFSEQVLHHALMNVCDPYFERVQVFDSYASRRGKGVHAALERAKNFTNKYRYYLKLDVKKFFDSIHHGVLKQQLNRLFKDAKVLDMMYRVIDSYDATQADEVAHKTSSSKKIMAHKNTKPSTQSSITDHAAQAGERGAEGACEAPSVSEARQHAVAAEACEADMRPNNLKRNGDARGVPIGNLSSQYFANHYMAELDHYIKEQLRIPAYVRYMDDLVLWHDDKAVLKAAYEAITDFVERELKCALKPVILHACSQGLSFVGYRVFRHHVRLTQRSRRRFSAKLRRLQACYDNGTWSEATCQRRVLSLLAFTKYADAKGYRKATLQKI